LKQEFKKILLKKSSNVDSKFVLHWNAPPKMKVGLFAIVLIPWILIENKVLCIIFHSSSNLDQINLKISQQNLTFSKNFLIYTTYYFLCSLDLNGMQRIQRIRHSFKITFFLGNTITLLPRDHTLVTGMYNVKC
jgi:hypothetical protein